MSVYTNNPEEHLTLTEQHLYGSARLGMHTKGLDMTTSTFNDGGTHASIRGEKSFELSNHLGNVLSVITDQKLAVASSSTIEHFLSEVVSYTDYYPFRAPMDHGASASDRSWSGYRYGFNSQEKEQELFSRSSSNYFTYRIHNSALGRFLSVDPLLQYYPGNSPYAFSENRVIDSIELEGLELMDADEARLSIVNGVISLKVENFSDSFQTSLNRTVSGRDRKGNPTIGACKEVSAFGIIKNQSGKFEHPDLNGNEMIDIVEKGSNQAVDVPDLKFQRDYNKLFAIRSNVSPLKFNPKPGGADGTTEMSGPSQASQVFARGMLILSTLSFIKEQTEIWETSDDQQQTLRTERAIKVIFEAINMSLEHNLIPEKYQNLNDVSIIMNLVLDGTGNEPLIKIGEDGSASIDQRALDFQTIANAILTIYSDKFEESGFSNVTK